MTSLELLQGIELWLTVKKEPSKEEVNEYLIEIRKHINEALAISRVSKSFYCYNKEKGFNHSLCKEKQCQKCKNVDEQCSDNMFD